MCSGGAIVSQARLRRARSRCGRSAHYAASCVPCCLALDFPGARARTDARASGRALLLRGRGAACGQRGREWRAALSRSLARCLSLARSLARARALSLSLPGLSGMVHVSDVHHWTKSSQRINLGYAWNDSPRSDIHKITKLPRLHCRDEKSPPHPPPHPLACIVTPCLHCRCERRGDCSVLAIRN